MSTAVDDIGLLDYYTV